MAWLREPYSPLEGGVLFPLSAAVSAAPLLAAGIACAHELATGATGEPLLRILRAYVLYLLPFSIQFTLLLGVPLVWLWDRLLLAPRPWFVLAAGGLGAGFAALIGWGSAWFQAAAAAAANGLAFVLASDLERRRILRRASPSGSER